MTRQHPKPAFDLLNSLPIPAEDSFLVDWHAPGDVDADPGDSLNEHPEIWEYIELPDCLRELSTENYVSFTIVPTLNLNAIAIGLGIEKIEYEPEVFPGLVYRPPDKDSTVLLSATSRDIEKRTVLSISNNPDSSAEAVRVTIEKIDELDLLDAPTERDYDMKTKQVEELIS